MIQKLSHATIYVLDQQEAHDFYVDKLGFEVRMDQTMEGGFRWLTVGPKTQPELEIILMPSGSSPMMDAAAAAKLQDLIRAGKMGTGVFATDDCQKTYEELKAKGVEFIQPPTERFYGIEAVLKDNSGNWFSLTQRKAMG